MERTTRQASSYRLLSYHHQRRPRHNMGIRDVLRIRKSHHRTRSETRDEDIPEAIEGPTDVGLTAPRFTESTPDLVADPPLPQTSSPSTPRVQEPKGTQNFYPERPTDDHPRETQTVPSPIDFDQFSTRGRRSGRNTLVAPLSKERSARTSQT